MARLFVQNLNTTSGENKLEVDKTYYNNVGILFKCMFIKDGVAYLQQGEHSNPMVLYSCNKDTGEVFPPLFSNLNLER
jgi:hypothetical protein